MDHEQAGDRIRACLFRQFPLARGRDLLDDDHLLEQGIIDSRGVVDLVVHLEKELGITVADDVSPEKCFIGIEIEVRHWRLLSRNRLLGSEPCA